MILIRTLEGSRNAVFCDPEAGVGRGAAQTVELDHVLASVFGLWSLVIPESRRFVSNSQLELPGGGFSRAGKKQARAKTRESG
ncbi:hypothetical protein G6O69_34600 [Pseudenhygromyxa sp. WMMC2535]|uniref:hypothetical protein n=1 Tax=Pseudenhygromyxa sp. WMMC2535 TaxID=2712867 RepID=UPI001555AA21|nr:hypothetical protein [Pseudenhygromyxa sp. WMMC2535]NVB43004.1 hypothetical protein [Pseudenhygromyxa sp. WMMC2535]